MCIATRPVGIIIIVGVFITATAATAHAKCHMGNLAVETGVSALLIYLLALLARALPSPVGKRPQRLLLQLHHSSIL